MPDSRIERMSPETAIAVSHKATELEKALRRVIRGKDDVVRLALVSIFARGHLLIEGVPGVGKTTLGQALARAIDCTFQRVQFTSDMLPSDVLGISVYSALEQEFEFKRGPVFTNVLLVDESLVSYALEIVRRTRESEFLSLGVSPRGSQALYCAAQAMAFLEGRTFCTPEDFKPLVVPVFAHRVVVNGLYASTLKKSEQSDQVLKEIIETVPVPV